MTWIACGLCQNIPCTCTWRTQAPAWPLLLSPGKYTAPGLSDEDVERIANRVVELLRPPTTDPAAQGVTESVVAKNQPRATRRRRLKRMAP